ncbi:MAG: hypothetical protein WCJ35_08150 [Planctomycetota bacterium]
MSQKHRKKSRNQEQPPEPTPKRSWTIGILFLIVAAGVACITWWPRGGIRPDTQPASAQFPVETTADPSPIEPAASNDLANDSAAVKHDMSKLKGRWRRSGEQYVLEVRAVDENGKVEAAYFNPQPIRVGRAMVKQKDGVAALFVELQDAGYPGCTYTLIHDPKTDQLVGVYYQAARQESYEIVFERIN